MHAMLLHLQHEVIRLRELAECPGTSMYDSGVRQVIANAIAVAETQHRDSIEMFSKLPHCRVRHGTSADCVGQEHAGYEAGSGAEQE